MIWDVRSPEAWNGTNARGNTRSGHVSGAVHLEWRQLMEGPPARRFGPAAALRELIAALGIAPEQRVVTY